MRIMKVSEDLLIRVTAYCRLIVNAKDISYQGKCMIFFMYHQYIDNVIRFTLIIYLLETIKPTYFIQSQLIWLIKVDDDTAMFEVPYLHFLALASFKWLLNSSGSKHYIESQHHSFTTWYPTRTTCLLFELWLGCSSKTPYSPKTHLHPTSRHGTSQKTRKISTIALQTRAI